MKAAVWYGQKDVRVEDRDPKVLKDDEVQVKVSWTGICGTDLHEYLEGPIFISTDKPDPLLGQKAPVTLGHEFSGVVENVGKKVEMKKTEDYEVPDELEEKFSENPQFKEAFDNLTPGRQRQYIYHISQAKRSQTRINRIEKYYEHILNGKGMQDK